MKTKTSILAALIALAGSATLMAQNVYSLNVVGYVNVTVPPGYSMIANQLNTTNMTIGALLPNPPDGTQILKWDGSGYNTYEYFAFIPAWSPDGNATLNPGEAAFIKNPTASNMTLTFVGEVALGTTTNNLPAGYAMRSATVPQAGTLEPGTNAPALNFPVAAGDQVLKWTGSGYDTYEFFDLGGGTTLWSPSTPSVNPGEGFFSKKTASVNWVRNFNPNN